MCQSCHSAVPVFLSLLYTSSLPLAVTFRSIARGIYNYTRDPSLALPCLLFAFHFAQLFCFFLSLFFLYAFGIICVVASTIWLARQGLRLRGCQLLPFLHSLSLCSFYHHGAAPPTFCCCALNIWTAEMEWLMERGGEGAEVGAV